MPEDAEACRQNRLRHIEKEEKKKAAAKKDRTAKAAQKKATKSKSANVTQSTSTTSPNLEASSDRPEAASKEDPCNLHPDDPSNFLKLSAALRILSQYVLTDADIVQADGLLRQYCTELISVSFIFFFRKTANQIDASCTEVVASDQTTTMRYILQSLFATSALYMSSGASSLNA